MNLRQTLAELKRLGTAQNVKTYRRHGVPGDLHGVSFGNLNKLAKKLKTDHALAEGLWASGNFDARVLATLVADPAAMTARDLDAWVRAVDCAPLCDYFVRRLVLRTPHAEKKAGLWAARKAEFVRCAGFKVAQCLAESDDPRPDAWFPPFLTRIEKELHGSANRARETMNTALIAIGQRNPGLRGKALRVAKKLGPVEIDHGETSCRTPDAVARLS